MEFEPHLGEYEPVRRECSICRYEVELDDVAVPGKNYSVCLGCYGRETGTTLPMPKGLRNQIQQVIWEQKL